MRILRIVLQIVAFAFVFGYPSKMDSHLHIFLSKKVSITVNKNYPSYVAYDAVNIKKSVGISIQNEPARVINLSTDNHDEALNHFHPLSKKMVLNAIVIKKEVQYFNTQAVNENYIRHTDLADDVAGGPVSINADQKNWVAEFKPYFRKKIQEGSVQASWLQGHKPKTQSAATTWVSGSSNKGPDTYKTFGSSNTEKNYSDEKASEAVNKNRYAATATELSRSSQNRIVGVFEIQKGLLYSNDDRFEIRRFEEGFFREKGSMNFLESVYEITPSDLKGFLLARMINKKGQILGEGIVRMSDVVVNKHGSHQGPTIKIVAKSDVSGRTYSSYSIDNKNGLAQPAKATIFQGQLEKPVGKDGVVKFDNVIRNSPTNMIVESKGHFASQQIILAGENFATEMIPEKMGVALKQIVSDLKQQNLNDPNLSIVLGKVTFDGQAVSGVSVKIENEPEIETIYFNSLMLPDIKLSGTSENGYYALIIEGGSLKTLMAYRGDRYFGHINTIVSPGITSYAEIQNTIKTETVDIKVYEPFTGSPEFSEIDLQGQSESITIEKGVGAVQLPYLGRWSFLYSNPTEKYIPAHYTYVDKSDYIYVPLVSRQWMSQVFTGLKLNVYPNSNMVIGFVIDEDFEIELPGIDRIQNHLLYFDYSGRITPRGTQGGGFILYNLPEGVYEPLVFGTTSQKVYSRIAPLKTNDAFVFTYKLDGTL
ncbi:MAG: hypothetical protein JNL11_12165 [Bdellovibrionaceae bacterium]|nr:hypothetical protein [Pseudobdellovibrionaceae bacterium]